MVDGAIVAQRARPLGVLRALAFKLVELGTIAARAALNAVKTQQRGFKLF